MIQQKLDYYGQHFLVDMIVAPVGKNNFPVLFQKKLNVGDAACHPMTHGQRVHRIMTTIHLTYCFVVSWINNLL